MLKVKLVVVGGDAKAKEVNLRLPTVIGRGRDVNLTLPHALVSRRHTELFEKDGYLYVKDLGSLNGTYVNNRKISSQQRLAPNELLTLGNVTFRAMYDVQGAQNSGVVSAAELSDTAREENRRARETNPEKDETVHYQRTDSAHVRDELEQPHAPKSAPEVVAAQKPACSPADGDKVETPSDIFSGEEEFLAPEKSISISALESLPPMDPSVSVMGSALNLGDQRQPSSVDAIDLDVEGQQGAAGADKSDAALGSFLKKLPR